MMPGFVDAHTDAVSFLATGVQDCYSCDEASSYDRHRKKLLLIHDDRLASQLFAKVIVRKITELRNNSKAFHLLINDNLLFHLSCENNLSCEK